MTGACGTPLACVAPGAIVLLFIFGATSWGYRREVISVILHVTPKFVYEKEAMNQSSTQTTDKKEPSTIPKRKEGDCISSF